MHDLTPIPRSHRRGRHSSLLYHPRDGHTLRHLRARLGSWAVSAKLPAPRTLGRAVGHRGNVGRGRVAATTNRVGIANGSAGAPTVGSDDITVLNEDVYDIFGLRNEGDDVISMKATVELDVKKNVPTKFIDKRTGLILIDDLIKNIVDSQSYDDDFVRRAVLVLMGTVLAPQSTKFVPYRYYKMVEDVSAIKSYNWNNFTLCYIYWEKLEPIGLDAFDPLSREYPLMLNWPETEGKKRDDYDKIQGWGSGNTENCISEEYRCAKVAREGTAPEEEPPKTKQKGGGRSRKASTSVVSSNTNYNMDRVMTYIKLLHKEMVMERLNTEGVMYKPNKRENVDEFDDVGEGVGMRNGNYQSKYGASKYWPDIESPTDIKIGTSFTGEATDPFIIEDNGNSPSSASTVRTKDFPSMSRTLQTVDIFGESMGGLSLTKSEESLESFLAKSKIANGDGSQDNQGKHKRNPSKYCQSPYDLLITCKKRVKKIINAYCKHLEHRGFADRHISTTWFPKFMLNRARGKTKSVNNINSEKLTRKTKVLTRVMDEYFAWDKVLLSYLLVFVSQYFVIALTSFGCYVGVFSYAR
ncbi:unnamed protein product [Triticum turgidum subsp. durum]|uniref:Aminotransferase-like plant mobile domain-containing protein n=1 Tax=Triticum turgidum subsp. durum TaxID=4567 RepID=A0A9R1S8P6_TRITD|nr:unnamed protein product [Triticum turgidum subsp. durum]